MSTADATAGTASATTIAASIMRRHPPRGPGLISTPSLEIRSGSRRDPCRVELSLQTGRREPRAGDRTYDNLPLQRCRSAFKRKSGGAGAPEAGPPGPREPGEERRHAEQGEGDRGHPD